MKLTKWVSALLASFLVIPSVSRCYAGGGEQNKEKIIIGTWNVSKKDAYDYTMRALNKGFKNIDTAKMYDNEEKVGKAIKEYEKSTGKKVFVTTKFQIFKHKESIESYIRKLLDESITNLGHVDEFLLHEIPSSDTGISLNDVLDVFKKLHEEAEYSKIHFGLSNVFIYDIDKENIDIIKVIQNPYWYTKDDSFFENYLVEGGMGSRLHKFCKDNNIKYETYKTLGHGILIEKYLPSYLVDYSIQKGFYPIVKASSEEHLDSLIEEFDDKKDIKKDNNELNFQIYQIGQY